MKVLLIEPDRLLAKTYTTFLRQNGFKVSCAADAQQAVHAIDTDEPDVIVLEFMMARHNGVEFLYELRSYHDLQHIPVVAHTFLSEGNMNLSADLLRALGVVRYMYKPATSLEKLRRALTETMQPAAT